MQVKLCVLHTGPGAYTCAYACENSLVAVIILLELKESLLNVKLHFGTTDRE